MLLSKKILNRVSCVLLMFVYISFLVFQVSYKLSVMRENGLLFRQAMAGKAQKESLGIAAQTKDALSKSKVVPSKRFFQHLSTLFPVPAVLARICFVPYQFERYTSPAITRFSARICPERGPPVTV